MLSNLEIDNNSLSLINTYRIHGNVTYCIGKIVLEVTYG